MELYSNNTALFQNYIVPFMGTMQLHEFSPKVIAVLYVSLQREPKITPQLMANIHKLLHSAFEQAIIIARIYAFMINFFISYQNRYTFLMYLSAVI